MTKSKIKRETKPMAVEVVKLRGAGWNTHRASRKDDAAHIGLVENIRANGMMHRVVVAPLGDGGYVIVDGHRRVEAAKALGWKEVPCEVHEGLTEEEAKVLTLSANVQRLENDPLREAACIQELAEAGKTYEEIAAVLGKDAWHVARRARLCNLTKGWVELFERADGASVALMEFVAAHETGLQDEVLEQVGEDEEVNGWDIRRQFESRLRKLDGVGFDTSECVGCAYNTATHGMLFAELEGECGQCEKAECYVGRWNATTDMKIEALRKKHVEVKEAQRKWDIPNSWGVTERKTKTNTEAWVYTDEGVKRLVWAEPRPEVAAEPAQTEEEKAEAKRRKAAHVAWKKHRASAYIKLREAVGRDEGKAIRLADALFKNGRYLAYVKDGIVERFTVGYVNDHDLHTYLAGLDGADLAAIGCERLTAEERKALDEEDPENTND